MLTAEAAYWTELRVEREEGREEGVEKVAREARKKGWDSAAIADITGLEIGIINSFPGPGDGAI
jgi:inosine/xanthosine triphosphate pyrophosphatase family protein